MFSSLKLSMKLSIGFGMLLLLMLISGGVALNALSALNNNANQLATNWLPSIREIGRVDHSAQSFRRNQLHYMGVNKAEERQDSMKSMEKALAEFEKARAAYVPMISSPQEKDIYEDFAAKWEEFTKTAKDTIAAVDRGDMAAAQQIDQKGLQTFRVATTELAKLIEINNKGGEVEADAAAATYAKGRTLSISIILLAMLVGVGVALALIRGVMGQLGEDPGYLYEISSKIAGGDLNVAFRPQKKQGGVYAVIQGMVATMKGKIGEAEQKSAEAAEQARLAKIATDEAHAAKAAAERAKAEGMIAAAHQLEKVVEVVSSASEELSAQVEQSSRGTEVQSQRVSETATAMEEMNATVLEVAKNASQAAESSASARLKASEGAKIVAQVINGITTMQNVSMTMKEDMGALGKQAEGIGQVMNVISDIADQTNLLALNAAIEAARERATPDAASPSWPTKCAS